MVEVSFVPNEISSYRLFDEHRIFPRRLYLRKDGKMVGHDLREVKIEERCNDTVKAMRHGIISIPLRWYAEKTENGKPFVFAYAPGLWGYCTYMTTLEDAKILLGRDFTEPLLDEKGYTKSPINSLDEKIRIYALLAAASQAIMWENRKHNAYFIRSYSVTPKSCRGSVTVEIYRLSSEENRSLGLPEEELEKILEETDTRHFYDWIAGKRYTDRY
jgi:hypothetical protein